MQEQGFSHRKLAGVAERAGRSEDAEHHLRQALGWYKKLVAKSPDSRNELAGTLAYLGLAREKAQRPHEAEEAYGKALALWKQLSDADPANEWYRQERAHFSVVLGNSLQAAGRPEEAIEYCSTCVRLNEQLVADFADKPHHRSRLAYGRGVFISLLSSLGHHEQVGNEIETVLKGSPSTEELNNIAWFLCSRSNPSAEGARQAVDLAQKAVELNRNAGHIWNTLGVAHYRAGSWPAAIEALQKARELNVDKHFSWDAFFLAMAYWQLDNPDQARKWFDHAVEWMEKNAKDNEELRRFRAEAEKLMKKE
jgi:tetratricopeptide (TPR) repeat protein